jgi:hypothetical protein
MWNNYQTTSNLFKNSYITRINKNNQISHVKSKYKIFILLIKRSALRQVKQSFDRISAVLAY